jgi:hypothetical protein
MQQSCDLVRAPSWSSRLGRLQAAQFTGDACRTFRWWFVHSTRGYCMYCCMYRTWGCTVRPVCQSLTVLYRVRRVKFRPPLRKVVVWLSDGVGFDTRCVVSSLVYQQPAAAVYRWHVVYIDWKYQSIHGWCISGRQKFWPLHITWLSLNMQHHSTQPRQ